VIPKVVLLTMPITRLRGAEGRQSVHGFLVRFFAWTGAQRIY
jgi:hypothetical protein